MAGLWRDILYIMKIYAAHVCAVLVIAGAMVFPFASHAFFPEELRKIHEQSLEQRESQREQFKQDVLEKRREMLSRWHERKEDFKSRLKSEQDRIKSEFEIRRTKGDELSAAASTTSGIQGQGEVATSSFLSVITKGAKNFVHTLFPFSNLFEN